MKKSIVLLVCLLFISALSALIVKNLKDTNSYISEQNSKISKIQAILLLDNMKTQIGNLLRINQNNDLDKIIKKMFKNYIPFLVDDIKLSFKLDVYEKKDLNQLNLGNEEEKQKVINFLNDKYVYNIQMLIDELKGKTIKTNKQLDRIINNFVKNSYDENIKKIRKDLGFKKTDKINKLYELYIKIDYLKQFIKAYYILNKNGGVEYFELSFK